MTPGDVALKGYRFFTSQGWKPHHAAGIVGNILAESAGDPTAVGDNGAAFGLFQHNGPRKKALETFAAEKGMDASDPETQFAFAHDELQTTEGKAGKALFETKDAAEAARVFSEKFERPGIPHLQNRIRYATQAFEAFGGGEGADTLAGGEKGDTMSDFAAEFIPGEGEKPKAAPKGASSFAMEFIPSTTSAQGPSSTGSATPAPEPTAEKRVGDMGRSLMFGGALDIASSGVSPGDVLDAVTQGVTLGQGRKLTALETAITNELGLQVSDVGEVPAEALETMDFWDVYDAALEAEGAQQARAREAAPVTMGALEIGGSVLTGAGVGAAAARRGLGAALTGSTTTGQVGRAAGAGAVAGASYGESENETGTPAERITGAATGAVTGAVGGVAGDRLARGASKLLGYMVRDKRFFRGGRITESGRELLKRNGIDPDQIGEDFAKSFADRIKTASPDQSARQALADEFGIPLTGGQAAGDLRQIAFEEAARAGARGQPALRAVSEIDEGAHKGVRSAVEEIAGDGGGNALGSAEVVGEAVKRTAAERRAAVREAYRQFDPSMGAGKGLAAAEQLGPNHAIISLEGFNGFVSRARDALRVDTFNPSRQAKGALREFRQFVKEARDGPEGTVGVSFTAVERMRQKLNEILGRAMEGKKPQTAAEIKALIGSLDDFVEDAFTNHLLSGSDAALTLVKDARAKHAAFRRMFGHKVGDDASKIISDLAEGQPSAAEVANWLYGASEVGALGSSVRVAKRLKSILDADQWETLKAGAWRRVTEPDAGVPYGAQRMATNIEKFISGKGRDLAGVMFTPSEIAKMRRFARVLRIMVPPQKATNRSGSGYEVARGLQDMKRAFMTTVGFATGGVEAGLAANILAGVRKAAGDRAAARTVRLSPSSSAPAAAAGALGGAAVAQNPLAELP